MDTSALTAAKGLQQRLGDTITEGGHACPQAAIAISLPKGLTEQVVTGLQASVNEALTSAVNLLSNLKAPAGSAVVLKGSDS